MTITTNDEKCCGCKGARYCGLCLNTERVRKLNLKSYEDHKCFVFNITDGMVYPSEKLSITSSSTEIIQEVEKISSSLNNDQSTAIKMDGILLLANFLTEEEESLLVNKIDKKTWVLSQSGRRKQDYGPRVNFKYQRLKLKSFLGIPDYADLILQRMRELNASKLSDYQPFELCNLEYCEERLSSIDIDANFKNLKN